MCVWTFFLLLYSNAIKIIKQEPQVSKHRRLRASNSLLVILYSQSVNAVSLIVGLKGVATPGLKRGHDRADSSNRLRAGRWNSVFGCLKYSSVPRTNTTSNRTAKHTFMFRFKFCAFVGVLNVLNAAQLETSG